jgi:4-hydroxy-3-polyprenylbenzoate decarboxylase
MIAADEKTGHGRGHRGCSQSSTARFRSGGLQCPAMPTSSLADFLEQLAAQGELTRVGVEVNAALEIAEITRRVAVAAGPALLFDHPAGQTSAVVTNLLGTESRACRALGVESLDELGERIESLIDKNTPHNWFERLKMTGDETGTNKFRPKSVKSGQAQQVVRLGRDVDLAGLPLTRQWPDESAASITAGLLITPERGTENRGLTTCPLMALDQNRLAIVDDGQSSFARHWSIFRAAGEKMPVAVVLGGDPAGIIAGSIAAPAGADAYHLIGLLRGKPLELVKCRTHAFEAPADADFIIEGYLDPEAPAAAIQSAASGGLHYRTLESAPVLQVTAITHRSHPILPAMIDSGSVGELAVLVKVRERLLLPSIRTIAPDVVDLHIPVLGGPHRYAVVSFRKTHPHHSRQIAAALWGSPSLQFTKFLILVDAGIDVHDARRVLAETGANVAPECDMFAHDAPAHASDRANTLGALGRHLAIDATTKIAGERSTGTPPPLAVEEDTARLVMERWSQYGLGPPPSGNP